MLAKVFQSSFPTGKKPQTQSVIPEHLKETGDDSVGDLLP